MRQRRDGATDSWQRGSPCCCPGGPGGTRCGRRNGRRAARRSRNRPDGQGLRRLSRLGRLRAIWRSSPRQGSPRTTARHSRACQDQPTPVTGSSLAWQSDTARTSRPYQSPAEGNTPECLQRVDFDVYISGLAFQVYSQLAGKRCTDSSIVPSLDTSLGILLHLSFPLLLYFKRIFYGSLILIR